MRYRLAFAALLLPLAGCVVPPEPVGYGYSQPGYSGAYPGGYPQPGYGDPGFAYNDGSPTMYVEGASMPLIFYGGGWGYWDHDRRWHRAPDRVEHGLNQRFPGGSGYHGWSGGPVGHSEPAHIGGFPATSSWQGRPGGPPPPNPGFAGRPAAPPPASPPAFVGHTGGPAGLGPAFVGHVAGVPPAGAPPAAVFHPQGAPPPHPPQPSVFNHPAGPPPNGHRPDEHH